jgi:predicted  nucleic acid-binding Zn-ribbon protein
MADDKQQNGEETPEQEKDEFTSDSGLGNLPPLSDFESQSGGMSDSELPPLGSFESSDGGAASDSGGDTSDSEGELPALSDMQVETPEPAGGGGDYSVGDFDSAASGENFSSGDTPAQGGGPGFQDLAADSDFSPETPDIGSGPGPGPSSSMDTPMFDSAFGGGDSDSGGFDTGMDTPAPTQAMSTPMFGASQAPEGGAGEGGFDAGAFGGGGGGMDFDAGTPAPDFSPDTGMTGQGTPVTGAGAPPPKKKGMSPVLLIVALIIGLVGGIAGAPFISDYLTFLPNPARDELTAANRQIQTLNKQLADYRAMPDDGQKTTISPAELEKLEKDILDARKNLSENTEKLESTTRELEEKRANLKLIEEDIRRKDEEFVKAQEAYEDLLNETAIVEARHNGLNAEVGRLSGLVGQYEDANKRRLETREALEHDVQRLAIQVKEGMPLTPDRFSHEKRVQAVEDLLDNVKSANWVNAELLNEYTSLYLKEMQIAAAREYFFAYLPLTDELGNKKREWTECLMLGNQAIYYRALVSGRTGIYTNLGDAQNPMWGFKQKLDEETALQIAGEIRAARSDNAMARIEYLTERQNTQETDSGLQKTYSSL